MKKNESIEIDFRQFMSQLHKQLDEKGKYFIYYEHFWEQGIHPKGNMLVVPNDPRFNEEELVGACVDMIMDYYDQTGRDAKNSRILLGASGVFKRLYKYGTKGIAKFYEEAKNGSAD